MDFTNAVIWKQSSIYSMCGILSLRCNIICSIFSYGTNATPLSASCHVISCELSHSKSKCVGRSNICSTCQKVSHTNRTRGTTSPPDQPLGGLQCDVAAREEKAGHFNADCSSNFFFFKEFVAWVEMYVDVHLIVIWKDWVFECFLLKRKFREKKMEEHNSENFMRLLSGNTNNTKQYKCAFINPYVCLKELTMFTSNSVSVYTLCVCQYTECNLTLFVFNLCSDMCLTHYGAIKKTTLLNNL